MKIRGDFYMEDNKLGTDKISRLFLTLVIPSILAMVVIGVQGMVDGLFLGNFVSQNAMASVNIAMPFVQCGTAVGMIISIGGMAFMARLLGGGDVKRAQIVFKTALITLIVSAFLLCVTAQLFGQEIAQALGANAVLLEEATLYIKTVSLFLPFLLQYFLLSFVNRIIDKPHLFLVGTVVSISVNLFLNYLFIVECGFGIRGAALATGLSQVMGFLINLPPVLSKKTVINIYEGTFDWEILGKTVYNGSSEGITSVAMAVTTLVFNLTFMHYYGESGVAAFSIISYISQLSNMIIFGLVDGISPIVSFNYGANLLDRVKKVVFIAMGLNLVIGIVTYCSVYLWGDILIGFFAKGDVALIDLTYEGAKLYATMFLLCGVNILASSYFTAIGDALKSVIISASRGLIFILVGVVTLPRFFDVTGVWLVAPFADLVTLVIVFFLCRKISFQSHETKP